MTANERTPARTSVQMKRFCAVNIDVGLKQKVLEYAHDLKQFWKRGYGHDINRKSGCSLFHDVFGRLDRVANASRFGQVMEAVTVQMGHSNTLLPLLTLLGFFRDDLPLLASNYASQCGRTFRTSRILPYSANLVFVLYDCTDGLRIQALLNEKPLCFPNITQQAPLYHTVKQSYQGLLQGCNFKKECQLLPAN
ncbi:hypothetical protein GJAV_G00241230 [Gymnothorax javanicus]|nr:hypothetical protein GJAV_G00241230 [Gymnothorax javanicus]